jgi:arylsulfatase A-like enzyme
MRSRQIKKLILVSALFSAGLSSQTFAANEDTGSAAKPNILLIISDDFGVDVTSGMYPGMIDELLVQYGPAGHNHPDFQSIKGHPASTPTLDKLAREGMVFGHVWAHPFCSPTRTSILTGLYSKWHLAGLAGIPGPAYSLSQLIASSRLAKPCAFQYRLVQART